MRAPTVHAIVTAVSRRLASLPVHVMRKSTVNGRDRKEHLGSHPVQRLLERPNDWQTRVSYWLDATSWLLRYGNFYAFKARGATGPIRRLEPIAPSNVVVEQDENLNIVYRVTLNTGEQRPYPANQIHHVRGAARDGIVGDSPVSDARESIAMEIAAEQFGASFFANGAMPGIIWKYEEGFRGFTSEQERFRFIEQFQDAYGQRKRFKAILPPKGIEIGEQLAVENDKAQFLELRKHQRTVIAGIWGYRPM
jgi:HK97 family phage portal protein